MSARGLSRRELLARSGALAGGALLLGSGWTPARALGQGAAPEWFEAPHRTSAGGVLSTQLRVAETSVPIGTAAGTTATRAVVYENSYPGPTLDIHAGDTLKVDFINRAPKQTNLHTHGLHVSPQQPSDDVLLMIDPGHRYRYRYDVPADHPGGTLWYHAHRHMLTDDQVFGGMFGLLIVRGALDRIEGIAGLPERQFQFSQMEVVDGQVADASSSSLSDQVTLVNGRYGPTLPMQTGQTQRWRLSNTSSVFLRVQLEGHPLHVIAVDGNALPRTEARDLIEIAPGSRFDVLVQPPAAGTFALRSLSWKSLGVFYESMVPVPQVLAQISVTGDPPAAPAPLPTTLLPLHDLRHAHVDRRRTFRLEEREPRGTGDEAGFEYYINGRLFDAGTINTQVPLGATEEWEFRNLTYEPHPLHIHVNPFQVVAIDGDRSRAENHYRDTALIPPFGSLTIRHRFLDYTGVFVMHCHILFHEDHGMMELIEVYDPKTGPGARRRPGMAMDHDHMDMR
jgi:FtsP/CotA-like multicopper oxidase with cupredoxin domain